MKILIYGWTGKGNCGDESYKDSFPALFRPHQLTFTDHLTPELLDGHGALVLGGGNILDIHHVGQVNHYARHLKGKRVVAFSVGFTDSQVQVAQLAVFDAIYVRDVPALERLREMGYTAGHYCPDAAFGLEAEASRGARIWEGYFGTLGRDLYEKKVAVVCNSHLIGGGRDTLARDALRWQMFATDLATVMDETPASFLLVPFGCSPPWDDRVANGWVGGQCKWFGKNVTLYDNLGVQATLDVLAASDAVVSMRFHSTVFAVVAGVPFLDVHHHDKNKSFLSTIGLDSWGVSYWDFSREQARSVLGAHLTGGGREPLLAAGRDQRALLRGGVDGLRFD